MGMKTSEYLMRIDLPYGKRVLPDFTEELFNRDYETIAKRLSVKAVVQEFYYSDAEAPWNNQQTKRRCELILKEWYAS